MCSTETGLKSVISKNLRFYEDCLRRYCSEHRTLLAFVIRYHSIVRDNIITLAQVKHTVVTNNVVFDRAIDKLGM